MLIAWARGMTFGVGRETGGEGLDSPDHSKAVKSRLSRGGPERDRTEGRPISVCKYAYVVRARREIDVRAGVR